MNNEYVEKFNRKTFGVTTTESFAGTSTTFILTHYQ